MSTSKTSAYHDFNILFEAFAHLICLELSHHIDQDAPVEHWMAVNGGDIVTNFLNVKRKVKNWLPLPMF